MNLPFKVLNITERHLEVVKHPRYGYGGNMNPCIDCHALMFRIAGEMLERENASFVVSGEVLGQRPMSQNRQALRTVAAQSGLDRLLLRPLSARLLPETLPEEKGWVERERLEAFQGRSRKPQMELARRFGIQDYPSPAGGCLLTEPVFSKRLRDLLEHTGDPEIRHIEALKLGRHFRLGPEAKLVVGRNKKENEALEALRGPADFLLSAIEVPGPSALLQGRPTPEERQTAAAITVAYSDARETKTYEVRLVGIEAATLETQITPKEIYKDLML